MNELHAKNFDAILSASLFPTVLREAQAFLDMDVSDVKDNPKFKNRILKIVQGKRVKSTRTPSWRIVLVAALLAISLIFTACMCIPKVREAIWNIIVEWYSACGCLVSYFFNIYGLYVYSKSSRSYLEYYC